MRHLVTFAQERRLFPTDLLWRFRTKLRANHDVNVCWYLEIQLSIGIENVWRRQWPGTVVPVCALEPAPGRCCPGAVLPLWLRVTELPLHGPVTPGRLVKPEPLLRGGSALCAQSWELRHLHMHSVFSNSFRFLCVGLCSLIWLKDAWIYVAAFYTSVFTRFKVIMSQQHIR